MLDLLRALDAKVTALDAKLDRLLARRPSAPLSRDDRSRLARLLPAAAGVLGSEPLHASELCEHESAALRLVCAGLSSRRLGQLFRRAADIPIAGYVVKDCGFEAGVQLDARRRGYAFEGAIALARLLTGVIELPTVMASPTGFEPVFWP